MSSRSLLSSTLIIGMLLASGAVTELVAQGVEEDWVATRSGAQSQGVVTDELGFSYVAGYSNQDANHNFTHDIIVIKYDLDGNEVWVREFDETGDATNGDDVAEWLTRDPFGNILVTGRSFLAGLGISFLTLKYDPEGNLLWKVRTADTYSAARVATDAQGNVYVAGRSSSSDSQADFVTAKYGPEGNELWVRVEEGGFGDAVGGLAVSDSGEVAVAGESSNGVSCFDFTTIVYEPDGTRRWLRSFSSPVICSLDGAADVAFGPAGEVYVGGHQELTDFDTDFTLIKYDAAGNELWVRTHGGPSGLGDFIHKIGVDSQGRVVVTGVSESDFVTIQYDADGNEIWRRQLDFASSVDEPYNLAFGPDDAVYLSGYATLGTLEMAAAKYNANGVLQWTAVSESTFPGHGSGIALDATGNVLVSGASPVKTVRYVQTEADVAVSVQPLNPPIVIPPEGGSFQYTVEVTNLAFVAQTLDVWIDIDGPVSGLRGPGSTTLEAGASFLRTLTQVVPAGAPAGTYTQSVSAGTFPDATAADSFPWEKLTGVGSPR